jgi:hypothetical protein
VSWFGDNKFWAVIAKLAILIGAIAAFVKTYEYFSPSKPKLIGYGSYFIYSVSPDFSGMLVNIRNSQSGKYTSGVQKALTDYKGKIGEIIDNHDPSKKIDELEKIRLDLSKTRINSEMERLVNRIFYDMLPPTLSESIMSYAGILHFYTENKGMELWITLC